LNNPADIDLITESVEYQETISELKDKISSLENKKSKKENEKMKIVNSIKQNNDLIESLKKHKYNPNCEFCISNLTVVQGKQAENLNKTLEENLKDINSSIQEFDEKINKHQVKVEKATVKMEKNIKKLRELYKKNQAEIENNNLKSLNDNLFSTQRAFNRIKQFVSKYSSIIENQEFIRIYEDKNIEKTISDFEDKQSKLMKIAGMLFNTQRKLVKIQLFISKYEEIIESEEFKDIYLDDDVLQSVMQNLKGNDEFNEDEVYLKIGKYQEKLNSIENDKEKIIELEGDIAKHKKKIAELENKQTVYLVYNYILSNDGIIQEKISFYTSGLLETMNKILKQYIEKEICLNTNGWYLTDGNGKQISISSASNMESNILNMVVKTVLNTCIGNKRCNIFMIDEGWDSFSEQNVSKRDNIIYEIATHVGQLIIISHLENMKKDMKTKLFIQNSQVKME
jgi:DNA repair exonuclease SbcCD ATPase subunit